MKSLKYWLLLILVLLFGLLLYWLTPRKPVELTQEQLEVTSVQLAESNAVEQGSSPSRKKAATSNAAPSSHPRTSPPTLTREQKLEHAPQTMNVPISFYGRVVDQDGQPLPGVRAVISIRQWTYVASAGLNSIFPKTELTTDSDGLFHLTNGSGDDLSLEALAKEGYEPEPKAIRGFGYTTSNPIKPDPNNPVVFRMWKVGTKQELVIGDKFLPIIPDGRTYTFDFLKGTMTEGQADGDLTIWVRRSDGAAWGKKYSWSFHISVVRGGLREETDVYASMFLAPEEGYAQALSREFRPSDEDWTYGVNRRFYLRARNGQIYGRVDIEIQAFYLKDKQGRLGIKYAVNPAASRVLR